MGGPGRYDYGRPTMPKGWFQNYFYGFWELGHILFVADRWIAIRCLRHFVGMAVCFFPFWVQMQWNVKMWEDFKKTHTMRERRAGARGAPAACSLSACRGVALLQ